MKIAFTIAHTRNNVVILFGTLKVQSFMRTEVRDCDLLIVGTSSTFLKRKDMLHDPRRYKTSSVGQSAGPLIPRSSVRLRQKLKNPITQIKMDLSYIDPQARVLNYCYK